MLKTSYRLDIEDKGQSGETFLAAVEYLELYAPPFAIFENVDGAPWVKMQEYITGRVDLAHRNGNKAITVKGTKKSKKNADHDLIFKVNSDRRYEVIQVPPQMGVRAGSLVEGVSGHDKDNPTNVRTIVADSANIGKTFNLGQLARKHGFSLGDVDDDGRVTEEGHILILEKKKRYCTRLFKLDTKDYGLPQTRNRKYLFLWRSDDPNDDLGDYFEEIMEYLKVSWCRCRGRSLTWMFVLLTSTKSVTRLSVDGPFVFHGIFSPARHTRPH